MTFMTVVSLAMMLTSDPASQAPRDRPVAAIETASRERELRSAVTLGTATRETFVELALLLIRESRFDEAIEALRGASRTVARFPETFDQAVVRLRPVRVGGGHIQPPAKVAHVQPVYPPIAQSARVQGAVIVEALIDEQGRVANARIVRSIPLLDAASLDCVSKWKYLPTDLDGRPVAVVMTVTVNFVLQ